jgi:hypothetical protein
MKERGPQMGRTLLGGLCPTFWERLLFLGGPEAAGKAPRTAKRQMPPAAEAQTQELAPKQAQPR